MFATQQITAQQSVIDAKKAAEKLNKKVNKKWFKRFKASYPQALKDIAKIETEATKSEFGYDKLADKTGNWIALNNKIKKLGSEVTYKGETIKLEYKDYIPLRDEARVKASKAHYDAALKIIAETKDYKKREVAIDHLTKCWKYDYVKEYKDKVKEQKALIHYEEGVRILTTSKTFAEKEESKIFFNKATSAVKNYKDSKNLIAKMYFDEAVRLSKTNDLKNLYAANKYFVAADKSVSNYKNCKKLNEDVKIKVAENMYQEGLKKSNENSFEAQKEAEKWFENAQTWVENYKDAAIKAKKAKKYSEARVLFVEKNGTLIIPKYKFEFQNATKDYIVFPNEKSELKALDMNNAKNYAKATTTLGYGFLLMKAGKTTTKFSKTSPTTTVKKIDTYYMVDKNTDKETETTKFIYNTAKNSKKVEEQKLYKYYEYHGKVSRTEESSKIVATYSIDIWDVRVANKPIKIGTYNYDKTFSNKKITEKYTGDAKAKPKKLTNTVASLKTEAELINQSKNGASVQLIIEANYKQFAKLLDSKIKFKKY